MTLIDFNKRYIKKRYVKLVLIITLLVVPAVVLLGCEDYAQDFGCEGLTTSTQPSEEGTQETTGGETPSSKTITTEDRAILAVREHLAAQAESYQAKFYLADYYTVCDEWNAVVEILEDKANVWQVVVHMTNMGWESEKRHWLQASWYVFQDGRVLASDNYQANALRIEAELQELSLEAGE